jgi:hypothetical protein
MLSVFFPNVIYAECHKKALYAECRYGECRYAECRGAELLGQNSQSLAFCNLQMGQ